MDTIDKMLSGPAAEPAPSRPDATQSATRQASGPARPDRPSPTDADADTVRIEALFPSRNIRLVIDETTGIVQAQVRDAATGRVLRKLPDDEWLRLSAILREFASQAIVDKSA